MLFAVGFFAETFHFRLIENANTVNAAFFPRLISVFVFLIGLAILFQGILAYKKLEPEEKNVSDKEKTQNRLASLRVAEVSVLLILAAAVFRKLGFILTMPGLLFLLFIIVEKKENRNYKLYALISIAAPVLMYFIFFYLFSTLLPMGLLRPFLAQYLL